MELDANEKILVACGFPNLFILSIKGSVQHQSQLSKNFVIKLLNPMKMFEYKKDISFTYKMMMELDANERASDTPALDTRKFRSLPLSQFENSKVASQNQMMLRLCRMIGASSLVS